MNDGLRPALAAHLATNRIKLVHVWQTAGAWNAMLEWPYDPIAKKPLVTEKHVTGTGDDACSAVIAGLDRMGHIPLRTRLFILNYMLGRM